MSFLSDSDCLNDLGDLQLQNLARELNISFCDRCYDRWDIVDAVWDRLFTVPREQQWTILVPTLMRYLRANKDRAPELSMGGKGRPTFIEEAVTLDIFGRNIFQFASLFGNAFILNEASLRRFFASTCGGIGKISNYKSTCK